jgi:hypothetical protein
MRYIEEDRNQQEKFLSHEVTKLSLYVDLPRCSRTQLPFFNKSKGKSPSMIVEPLDVKYIGLLEVCSDVRTLKNRCSGKKIIDNL